MATQMQLEAIFAGNRLATRAIEQEKDTEKEKVDGRPAKLNEKKSDKDLEREIKNKGDNFYFGRTT